MARKRYKPEEIVAKLRQVDVLVSQGQKCCARRTGQSTTSGSSVSGNAPKRGRLWLTNGSCIRLRPEQRNHVWSYDFVEDRTHDGRKYRMLNVLAEFTHECLAIRVARKLRAIDVIERHRVGGATTTRSGPTRKKYSVGGMTGILSEPYPNASAKLRFSYAMGSPTNN